MVSPAGSMATGRWTLFLHRKADLVASIQLGLMIVGNDTQLQNVGAGFDAIQSSLFAFEHTHQFVIDVGVNMVSGFSLHQLKLDGNLVAFERLSLGGCEDLDAGAFRGLERRLSRR